MADKGNLEENGVTVFLAACVVALYTLSAGFFLAAALWDRAKMARPGVVVLLLGMAAHIGSLGFLVGAGDLGVLFTEQHWISILSLLLGGILLALRSVYRLPLVASVTVPLMALLQSVFLVSVPGMQVSQEFHGPLLVVHIAMAMLGTALFALAALTGSFYLIQDRNLRRKKFGPWFNRLPSVDVLDRASSRLIFVGFPIYTLAIGLGALWAWDTSQSLQIQYPLAMVSWLIYAAVIQARVAIGWRGRRAAWLTLAGCVGLGMVLSIYMVR